MDIPITIENATNEQRTNGHNDNGHTHNHEPQKSGGSRIGLFIIILLVIAGGIWFASRNQDAEVTLFSKKTNNKTPELTQIAMQMQTAAPTADALAIGMQNDWIANISDITFTRSGTLSAVSGGNATGAVGTDVITGVYHLYATFDNLPTLADGSFYEGWVVRTEPLSIVSTGALVMQNGHYVNAYLSRTNLLDHDTYVLTTESDDGNVAPGAHILEGAMVSKK
ncbi:hypothetical protein BK004_03635 [bacterium CG10_46_32]|nr:MAG: hypothetical protein BK004_03635 [bacterium CG10_46_32]PIR55890.1 MAG: hypothetical protein COU73_03665 [Parcubacteria group bacterium CG10_big_fil_rev_8_21_14_0_10_46_32]